jgi:hypothetical protein
MTIKGCDYAFDQPSTAALAAAGIGFACRYLSTDPAKNLTVAERDSLHAAGISIVLVWETTGTSALSGYNQGLSDAHAARTQATALGFPASLPIYYAVDFNATTGQMSDVLDYLHGAADAEGSKDRVSRSPKPPPPPATPTCGRPTPGPTATGCRRPRSAKPSTTRRSAASPSTWTRPSPDRMGSGPRPAPHPHSRPQQRRPGRRSSTATPATGSRYSSDP